MYKLPNVSKVLKVTKVLKVCLVTKVHWSLRNGLRDPVDVVTDPGVDARIFRQGAPLPVAHDANEVGRVLEVRHPEGASGIALARILTALPVHS